MESQNNHLDRPPPTTAPLTPSWTQTLPWLRPRAAPAPRSDLCRGRCEREGHLQTPAPQSRRGKRPTLWHCTKILSHQTVKSLSSRKTIDYLKSKQDAETNLWKPCSVSEQFLLASAYRHVGCKMLPINPRGLAGSYPARVHSCCWQNGYWKDSTIV